MSEGGREAPVSGEELGKLPRLPARGRAARYALGEGRELHRLGEADARLVRRVVRLGEAGVFGCEDGGIDESGPWFVLAAPRPTLDEVLARGALGARAATALFRRLAGALAACEADAIFPGNVRPKEIGYAGGRAHLHAASLLSAWLGEASPTTPRAPSRWDAPELAAGEAPSSASNRYALGLVVYCAIAGRHPFAGLGMRQAQRASEEDPPPFTEAIASTLEPGMQSLVLSLLSPRLRERPRSAAEIVKRIDDVLSGSTKAPRTPARAPGRPSATPAEPSKATPGAEAGRRGGALPERLRGWVAAPLAIASLVGGIQLAMPRASEAPRAEPHAKAAAPLTRARAADCAPCHAREVSEWERSVMAHAAKSPLFGALESVAEEQTGRDSRCPNGAGLLRKRGGEVCTDARSGVVVTGSGGEHWCVNCHAPSEAQKPTVPAWAAFSSGRASARAPLVDVLGEEALEGISCASCHETIAPVAPHGQGGRYEGNPTWTSTKTGAVFLTRPEDAQGRAGISNSGYRIEPSALLGASPDGRAHRASTAEARAYRRSSEFCGACHDVRLFGTDAVARSGDHFKRLRNGYSEWRAWADLEASRGRRAATCQDCHMSTYPGVCLPGPSADSVQNTGCPPGTHFAARAPGEYASGLVAPSSSRTERLFSHFFTSVDVPLTPSFPESYGRGADLDARGTPLGLRARRDMLLARTFRFELGAPRRAGRSLEIPVVLENVGAGHRVPAGFSQEREVWVELRVTDARGATVYQVGHIDDAAEDLRDKRFLRVNVSDDVRRGADSDGRPLGVFGADVSDGPDVPEWSPNPRFGGARFRGKGLINLQNGFLRCVKCIGVVDPRGKCLPGPGQGRTRADRYDDGLYDQDTGECRSNLSGGEELFETYFPLGGLDADRGVLKAPDAIVDTRSAPPGVPLEYTYVLDTAGHEGPFRVEAKLRFRSFPPFLVRAFAAYEAERAARGERPSGAQVTLAMLERVDVVELARATARVE